MQEARGIIFARELRLISDVTITNNHSNLTTTVAIIRSSSFSSSLFWDYLKILTWISWDVAGNIEKLTRMET